MADGARAQRQTGLQTPQLQGDEEGETTLQWIKTMTLWKINMLTIVVFFYICLLRFYPTVRCGFFFGKPSWAWVWEAPSVCGLVSVWPENKHDRRFHSFVAASSLRRHYQRSVWIRLPACEGQNAARENKHRATFLKTKYTLRFVAASTGRSWAYNSV